MSWNGRTIAAVQSRIVRLINRHLQGIEKPRPGDPYERQVADLLVTITATSGRRSRYSIATEKTPRKRKTLDPRPPTPISTPRQQKQLTPDADAIRPQQKTPRQSPPQQRRSASRDVSDQPNRPSRAVRVDIEEADHAFLSLIRECRKLIESKHIELTASAEIEKQKATLEGKKLDIERLRLELEKHMISETPAGASNPTNSTITPSQTLKADQITEKVLNLVLKSIQDAEEERQQVEQQRMQRFEETVEKLCCMGEGLLKSQADLENTFHLELDRVAQRYERLAESEKDGMQKLQQAVADISKTQDVLDHNANERYERLDKEKDALQSLITHLADKLNTTVELDRSQENGPDELSLDGQMPKDKSGAKDSSMHKEKPTDSDVEKLDKDKSDDVNKRDEIRDGLEELLATLTEEKNS